MRLVENFVIQALGASLIARSQLTPHRNQNLANLWIGIRVYIKGVVVQNEMEIQLVAPIDYLVEEKQKKRI